MARRRRGAALEQAILEAGWDQLLEGGYQSLTIEAVAERAGTSRSVIYRRWPDRSALVEAVVGFGLRQGQVPVPDTGTLRGDMIELMRRSNAARAQLIPLITVFAAAYFAESGRSFADVRRQAFGDRLGHSADVILDRAVARGEIDAVRLTPRVRTVAFDLFRHDLLMNLKSVPDEDIAAIVDEIFLPLVSAPRPSSPEPPPGR